MDELAESIGRLSTTAREWKPGGSYGTSAAPQSPGGGARPALTASPPPRQQRASAIRHSPPGRTVSGPSSIPEWRPAAANAHEFVARARSSGWQPTNESNSGGDWRSDSESIGYGEQQQQQQSYGYGSAAAREPQQDNRHEDWPDATTLPAGPPPMRSLHAMGLPDELWRFHRDVSLEASREMDPTDVRHKAVPPSFANAFSLDDKAGRSSFGYPTSVFKVASRENGHLYCLRRMDSVRSVSHKIATAVTHQWANASTSGGAPLLEHPGLVRFYRCFLSNRAIFFLHQYIPGARTLRERFLPNPGAPLPEALLWSCLTQLVSAIRMVHGASLACRTLQLNHILCTHDGGMGGRVRLRINCLGVVDALEFEARKALVELQREDLGDLGRILFSLGTGTEVTRTTYSMQEALQHCDLFFSQNYSRELHGVTMSLLSHNPLSIFELSSRMAQRILDELDRTQVVLDRTDAALAAEYESGRALRLLLKLGFVNERPEFGVNRRWSESGDCYVLKLFRDYVFHQADGTGRPVMDLGHVVSALNKLDAADEEKIVLASRDGKSLMVVSYADVARCLEGAYDELCAGSVPPTMDAPGNFGAYHGM